MGLRTRSLPCPAPPCHGTGIYGQGGVWARHCRIYEAGGEQSAAPSARKWTACDRDLAPHGATMDARAVLVGLVLATLPTPGLGAPVESDTLQSPRNKLLLVSFDGFRWDYDQDVDTPNLDAMVREGVKARHMTPAFVTLTSPCHFTLVTGEDIWHSGVPDGGPGHRRGQAREGCRDWAAPRAHRAILQGLNSARTGPSSRWGLARSQPRFRAQDPACPGQIPEHSQVWPPELPNTSESDQCQCLETSVQLVTGASTLGSTPALALHHV